MNDRPDEVVIVLGLEEAWDVFLRLVYSAEEDSPHVASALRKFAKALGSEWALPTGFDKASNPSDDPTPST
jgi:hypothetical protein